MVALAQKAGVQKKTIYGWFKGQVPAAASLAKVAEALNLPISDLYAAWDGSDPMPTTKDEQLTQLILELQLHTEQVAQLTKIMDGIAKRAIAQQIVDAMDAEPPPPRRMGAVRGLVAG